MTVTLDQATADFVQLELERGHFASAEEVIVCAVQRLAASAEDQTEAEQWLLENRDEIERGIEESFAEDERGEGSSPEEAMAILEKRRIERAA